jgi:FtsP/CotA-like multicopper oxidase with cupredoxin domain
MTLVWSPSRPGGWLFHCHLTFHVVTEYARFSPPDHSSEHMAGLVLGMDVRPGAGWVEPARPAARQLRMTIDSRPRWGRAPGAIGVTIAGGGVPTTARGAGPPLLVTRGQPTDVTVWNRLAEPTAIHWHGLELESYSDGVAGWSGSGGRRAPMIAAGDSFTARLTLPRAGTFIYHTHLNDLAQLTSGLYGGIVALEPGQTFDAARDHLFVLGWDGLDEPLHIVVNGDSTPPPLELVRGVPHRLRFVNIGPAQRLRFELWRDTTLVNWRPLAADGAALDADQTRPVPAFTLLPVGTTADVEFLSPDTGTYRLTMGLPGKPFVTQVLVVR